MLKITFTNLHRSQEKEEDKRKDGKTTSVSGLDWTSQRVVEDRTRWREIVRTATMVPLRPDGIGGRYLVGIGNRSHNFKVVLGL